MKQSQRRRLGAAAGATPVEAAAHGQVRPETCSGRGRDARSWPLGEAGMRLQRFGAAVSAEARNEAEQNNCNRLGAAPKRRRNPAAEGGATRPNEANMNRGWLCLRVVGILFFRLPYVALTSRMIESIYLHIRVVFPRLEQGSSSSFVFS